MYKESMLAVSRKCRVYRPSRLSAMGQNQAATPERMTAL